mmetsp:Transcript_31367/g.41545  ORF Transcript_31367/g.41545 Transcript_31367/m.41545 type:complete len:98 (+) Transcript_31367:847-1140(+)
MQFIEAKEFQWPQKENGAYITSAFVSTSVLLSRQKFYRVFLTDFLASVGGLIVSMMAGAKVILSGHHAFFHMLNMTQDLYTQAESKAREQRTRSGNN